MTWDPQQVSKYRRLVDGSPEAEHVQQIAKAAFEGKYQGEKRWEDLNPQVRDHWLEITAAVLAAVEEAKA